MIKELLILSLALVSSNSIAGTSPTQEVEGIITKIEGDKVTVVYQGKDVIIDKKFVPKDKLRAGKQVSIILEAPPKK